MTCHYDVIAPHESSEYSLTIFSSFPFFFLNIRFEQFLVTLLCCISVIKKQIPCVTMPEISWDRSDIIINLRQTQSRYCLFYLSNSIGYKGVRIEMKEVQATKDY
jgi:hypothetical protein